MGMFRRREKKDTKGSTILNGKKVQNHVLKKTNKGTAFRFPTSQFEVQMQGKKTTNKQLEMKKKILAP